MSNSIVFISKPAVIHNTLPQTRPDNFIADFRYEMSKPVNLENISLAIELSYRIHLENTPDTIFEFSTYSVCEVETKHSENEMYPILHRAMKVVIDNFRDLFTKLDLQGYTDSVDQLFPYPKYDVIQPILRQIFNPVVGFVVN